MLAVVAALALLGCGQPGGHHEASPVEVDSGVDASIPTDGAIDADVPADSAVAESALYVSLSGSDTTGEGSFGSPFRTLKRAADAVTPGDTIYLRGGYYDEHAADTYLTVGAGNAGELYLSGTEAAPITIQSYPGEWAILDGINHPAHPRVFVPGGINASDAYEPYLIQFIGRWVHWRDLEIRNSYGGGFRAFALDSKWIGCVFRNNHAVGLNIQGSRNEVAYCLFLDNYSISNDGASANGMFFSYSDQLTRPDRFPDETGSFDNHVHHCVAYRNSDDGFGTVMSKRSIVEHNVALFTGCYGTTGDGVGFKMGFDNATDTGTISRFNLSAHNKRSGWNTNYSTGVLIHNNTSHDDRTGGFALWVSSRPGSGANTAHNNLSVYPTNGVHRMREVGLTVHTHNAGYTGRWDPGGGEGNVDVTDQDPKVLSYDWQHPSFLQLDPTTPYANAGKTDFAGANATLGAIPVGEEFAGGWDWRALLGRFPSVEQWPMPQQ